MTVNSDKHILAVDIGGSKLMLGIVNSKGEVICRIKKLLNPLTAKEEIINTVLAFSNRLRKEYANLEIDCVGVTIPGLVDAEHGIWVYSPFSGIKDVKISEILSTELSLPVFIQNDVTACAYGEKIFGCCKEINDFIWITISNGIGGGLVLNGKIYEGAFKNAGEIGHMNVMEKGELCRCGNKGCLEAYASGASIARRYIERKKTLQDSCIFTAKTIADAARAGDTLAQEIYREAGYLLGKGISNAINLINPQKVILGGGVSTDMDLFTPALQRAVDEMVFKEANKNVVIERTALSYEAALVGAAAIAQKGMGRIK